MGGVDHARLVRRQRGSSGAGLRRRVCVAVANPCSSPPSMLLVRGPSELNQLPFAIARLRFSVLWRRLWSGGELWAVGTPWRRDRGFRMPSTSLMVVVAVCALGAGGVAVARCDPRETPSVFASEIECSLS